VDNVWRSSSEFFFGVIEQASLLCLELLLNQHRCYYEIFRISFGNFRMIIMICFEFRCFAV
jgi:hypothetical protein